MSEFIPTGSQTVGPFFNFALTSNAQLGILASEGDLIRVQFQVLDGDATPAPGDAMIELWQPGTNGGAFGRLETDANGVCTFTTVRAPHIHVIVFARGLLKHLFTRLYFEGEPSNAEDPVLQLVPVERRHTLMARPDDHDGKLWRMTIRLQGDPGDETVFFDL